ncbi:hypothetical protein [Oceanobacillus halophilus]|uniref:Uncharacterized protein n=1 Tax=Oceanobacillus halophilus TaxID=930130 RepID=A0A494ZR71_9BACI|nr:hypothetical protein [Oceanobacillus halophilus]RKQ28180.1 hypothetical protein D8M06_19175 [Oceanobacillus halophilus]
MCNINFIKQGLYVQNLPIYEADIPYIQDMLHTIQQAQLALEAFPHLHDEVPITIVDKGLIR